MRSRPKPSIEDRICADPPAECRPPSSYLRRFDRRQQTHVHNKSTRAELAMTTTAHRQRICCIPGDLLELTESPEKKLDDSDAPTMMMAYDDEDCVDITLGPGIEVP